MRSWPLSLLSLTMLLGVAGCTSRRIEPALMPTSAAAHSNATVRKVTYFAAWVDDERPSAAQAAATSPQALTPTRDAPSDKRGKVRSKASSKTPPRPVAAVVKPAPVPASRAPQPRYEYTVELDDGSYRTMVGQRDLGLRVNDRVLVQGESVTAAVH